MGWSVMLGTGLVVARVGGGWTPPSALGLCGFGWGLQAGGALCDVLIVLRNRCGIAPMQARPDLPVDIMQGSNTLLWRNTRASAVMEALLTHARPLLIIVHTRRAALEAFCSNVHCGVGGSACVTAGPLGRRAEAAMRVSTRSAALCYSYSECRGAFAGVALEGSLLAARDSVNADFYGRPLPARQLLLGGCAGAPAAAALYAALDAFAG